jgi:hypothetical protein
VCIIAAFWVGTLGNSVRQKVVVGNGKQIIVYSRYVKDTGITCVLFQGEKTRKFMTKVMTKTLG